jgi:large subunit ribosomal protein L29
MQISEIRALSDDQLREEHINISRELMNLRFRAATNQMTDTNMPRKTRRDIARVMTVMRERNLTES